MNNQDTFTEHQLNDQLAQFTDHLLDKNISVDLSEVNHKDQTLLELQKTVLHLAQAFESETSEQAVAQKIKFNLKKEWRKTHPIKEQESLWQRWIDPIKRWFAKQPRNRRTAYSLAAASLVLVFLFLSLSVLFPGFVGGQDLTGSATGGSFPIEALVVFVIVIGLAYLIWRRNR